MQEMGGLRKWGAEGNKEEGKWGQNGSFDLLLSVASNVMHSQGLHSFTIIHMPEHNSSEESPHIKIKNE